MAKVMDNFTRARWRNPVERAVMRWDKAERRSILAMNGWERVSAYGPEAWRCPFPWQQGVVFTLAMAIREQTRWDLYTLGVEPWCTDDDCAICAEVMANGILAA